MTGTEVDARLLGTRPETGGIVVFRALALGDLLCAVPALRALRSASPFRRISLIAPKSAGPFVLRFGAYVDELVEFPGFPGLPEVAADPREVVRFLSTMQARRFDVVVQMHGSGVHTNAICALFGARRVIGAGLAGLRDSDEGTWVDYPAHASEIRRCLAPLGALGIVTASEDLEFPLWPEDRLSLGQALRGRDLEPGTYAVVHAGATRPTRRWPPERFAAVADELAARGLAIVLTGVEAEAETVDAVRRSMTSRPIDLVGQTDLGALGRLVADARLVVTNDTSVSHRAAATRTPSVVVFLASDPGRWAPLDRDLHVAVGSGERNACDLAANDGARPTHRCLEDGCVRPRAGERADVPVADVMRAVERLLAGARDPRRASTGPRRLGPATRVAGVADRVEIR